MSGSFSALMNRLKVSLADRLMASVSRFKKVASFLGLSVSVLCLTACTGHSADRQEQEVELASIFMQIQAGHLALYAPYSDESLAQCQSNQIQHCVEVYEGFVNAAQRLLSMDQQTSLPMALDIIERACAVEDGQSEPADYVVCFGGLRSLYAYRTAEQDAIILDRFKNFPGRLQRLIFGNYFDWFLNRPAAAQWIAYVQSLDLPEEEIKRTLSAFNKGQQEGEQQEGPKSAQWIFRKAFDGV